jgi:FkbM family methyltransferase
VRATAYAIPPTLKRRLSRMFERLSGDLVVPCEELHLVHERAHLRRLFAYLSVDCVFDVGANRGQYAQMLRDHVGYRGPIVSYEPIPELAAELRLLSTFDSSWHIAELALDREAGPAIFHVMADSQFSSLHHPAIDQPAIFTASNSVAREVTVMRATVGAELPKWRDRLGFTRPFLKMDTQGNDFAVVEGAGADLGAFVGLQSELAIHNLYDGAVDFAACIAAFTARGFELSAFVPNNAGHFPRLFEIDCVMFNQAAKASASAEESGPGC